MLLGLIVELAAVAKILLSVEAGKEQWRKARAGLLRARRKLPKWLPGALRAGGPQRKTVNPVGETNVAGAAQVASSGLKLEAIPQSFEEVGERLNQIAKALYASERKSDDQNQATKRSLEDRVGAVTSDVARRDSAIRALVDEETKNRIAERKWEGVMFMGGVALQLTGTALLIFC